MRKATLFVLLGLVVLALAGCGVDKAQFDAQATKVAELEEALAAPTQTLEPTPMLPTATFTPTSVLDVEGTVRARVEGTMSAQKAVEVYIAATDTPVPFTPTPSTPTDWPTTAQEFLGWVTEGQPVSDGTWLPIELGEVHTCVGETYCWAVAREKDLEGKIIPFWVHNPTFCMQDGWMNDPDDRAQLGRQAPETAKGSGIPANWSGLAQGATFRPCGP